MVDRLMAWVLFTVILFTNAYSLIAPFVPIELERKGIPGAYSGMVYAVFAVAQVIFSPLVGKTFDRVGHKNLLAGGIVLMGIGVFCFAFIIDMERRVNVLALAFICRFFQGACAGLLVPGRMIIIVNDYPDQKLKLFGILEATMGIGLITGPIIGSAFYDWFGFKGCFFIFGGFEIVVGITMRIMLPERRK